LTSIDPDRIAEVVDAASISHIANKLGLGLFNI
jgi:hypothetical protein